MTENNEKTLKVALIGIGRMGYCHYCCYDDIPGAEIIAVCDVRADMAKEKSKSTPRKNPFLPPPSPAFTQILTNYCKTKRRTRLISARRAICTRTWR